STAARPAPAGRAAEAQPAGARDRAPGLPGVLEQDGRGDARDQPDDGLDARAAHLREARRPDALGDGRPAARSRVAGAKDGMTHRRSTPCAARASALAALARGGVA